MKHELSITMMESPSLYSALLNYRYFVAKKLADSPDDVQVKGELMMTESLIHKVRENHRLNGWDASFLG